jgi:response regulator RpfG family c-di-GMP phosphodiesterase
MNQENKKYSICPFNISLSVSHITDMASPIISNHHKKVTYIVYQLLKEMDLDYEQKHSIIIASALHDIGIFPINGITNLAMDLNDSRHAEVGYKLFHSFEPFKRVAKIIKYHHEDYNSRKNIPLGSYLINLANVIDINCNNNENILHQKDQTRKLVKEYRGNKLHPELVDLFLEISKNKSFWLNIVSSNIIESELKDKYGKTELDYVKEYITSFD